MIQQSHFMFHQSHFMIEPTQIIWCKFSRFMMCVSHFMVELTRRTLLAIEIIEAHARGHETQLNSAGGTVALFGEDDFGDVLLVVGHARLFIRGLVLLFAID